MTQMDQPPLDSNRRRKGYIKIRKELWDAKGYDGFGFSIQNWNEKNAMLRCLPEYNTVNKPFIIRRKLNDGTAIF